MKHTALIVTGIALLIGVALFFATDSIGKQQRMSGQIFDAIQLKVAYTPLGEPKIFANVPARSLQAYPVAEGVNIPEEESMVIGSAEAQMMREEGLFKAIGDRIDPFFGVPATIGGVLKPTGTLLDDMHFLSGQQFDSIQGEAGKARILKTKEGMPKLFYAMGPGERALALKLQEGDINDYQSIISDGKTYHPVLVGSREAQMMREEKLFERTGDRLENFFGTDVFIAGVLSPTNTSVDMMHIVIPGTIAGNP